MGKKEQVGGSPSRFVDFAGGGMTKIAIPQARTPKNLEIQLVRGAFWGGG